MDERLTAINGFLTACDELINGTYVLADVKISEVLKSIAGSKDLTDLFSAVTERFDYPKAKQLCLRFPAAKGAAHGAAFLPSDRGEVLAFVFCLLVEFDGGAVRLNDFLLRYFYDDGSVYGSFYAFSNQVIKPFRNAVRTVFAEGAAQSAPRPPLEEERSLVYRSSMPDGQKVDALLLLNGLERAKRDGELYCALLAGYLWFAKSTGWKSEHLAALADDLARRKEDL